MKRLWPLNSCLALSCLLLPLWTFGPAMAGQSQATSTQRQTNRQNALSSIKPAFFDLALHPIEDAQEKHWQTVLWSAAITNPQDPFVAQSLAGILDKASQPALSAGQQKIAAMGIKLAIQLYSDRPGAYAAIPEKLLGVARSSDDINLTALALTGLEAMPTVQDQLAAVAAATKMRFPLWMLHERMKTTLEDLDWHLNPASKSYPPLKDLLSFIPVPGMPTMYVLCRPDRKVLCRTLIKDGQGQFLQAAGQPWSVSLLARSLHNLRWNMQAGNTPQGIFRVEGTLAPTPDTFRAFGQFPRFKLFMPFESEVKNFLPNRPGPFFGSLNDYQQLFPATWRSYPPMAQSYWAGKIGRSLVRIHGTGEDPALFYGDNPTVASATPSYPWNPSIGCLSALERYDAAGNLVEADMPKILEAFTRVQAQPPVVPSSPPVQSFAAAPVPAPGASSPGLGTAPIGVPSKDITVLTAPPVPALLELQGYLVVADLPSSDPNPIALQELSAAIQSRTK
jgi:hypothetical protein